MFLDGENLYLTQSSNTTHYFKSVLHAQPGLDAQSGSDVQFSSDV